MNRKQLILSGAIKPAQRSINSPMSRCTASAAALAARRHEFVTKTDKALAILRAAAFRTA